MAEEKRPLRTVEVREPEVRYNPEYHPKRILEQIEALKVLFPDELREAEVNEELVFRDLPVGAEAYFAIPRWEKLASMYHEAVEKVLVMIEKNRNGNMVRRCHELPRYLVQKERTMTMWNKLCNEQSGREILIVPVQFGLRHFLYYWDRPWKNNEFCLGTFAVGIMLLTHPERLWNDTDLFINCGGDDYRGLDQKDRLNFIFSDLTLGISKTPFFHFNRQLEFYPSFLGIYASATAFISQEENLEG